MPPHFLRARLTWSSCRSQISAERAALTGRAAELDQQQAALTRERAALHGARIAFDNDMAATRARVASELDAMRAAQHDALQRVREQHDRALADQRTTHAAQLQREQAQAVA